MDCRESLRLLSGYVDDRLSPAERRALEDHLHACARCAKDLAMLQVFIREARACRRIPAPRNLARNVRWRLEQPSAPAVLFRSLIEWMEGVLSWRNVFIAAVVLAAVTVFNPLGWNPRHTLAGKIGLWKNIPAGTTERKNATVVPVASLASRGLRVIRQLTPMEYRLMEPGTAAKAETVSRRSPVTDKMVPLVLRPHGRRKKMSSAALVAEINAIVRRNRGGARPSPDGDPRHVTAELPAERYVMVINELNELGILQKPLPRTPPSRRKTLTLQIHVQ